MRLQTLLLLTGAIAYGDPLIGTTTCTATVPGTSPTGSTTITTTQPGACSIPLGDPGNHSVSATANGDFTLGDLAGPNLLTLHTDTSTPYFATPGGIFTYNLQASSYISDTHALATTGAVRSGFLQYQGSYDGVGPLHGGMSYGTFTLGSIVFNPGPFPTASTGVQMVPWTLGSDFTLSSYSESSSSQAGVDEPFGVHADLSLQFRLFEADGTTPVAVVATPEPATAFLSLLPLAAFAAFRIRRRRNGPDRPGSPT